MDNHPPREVDDEQTEAACMKARAVGRLETSVFPLGVSTWEEDDRTRVGVCGFNSVHSSIGIHPHSIHKTTDSLTL